MNNMFSKAAIWVVIALVLFMVFKQFDSRSMATNAKAIAYSDFISEVKAGHIKDATIEDRTIVATTQDGTKVKRRILRMRRHRRQGDGHCNGKAQFHGDRPTPVPVRAASTTCRGDGSPGLQKG